MSTGTICLLISAGIMIIVTVYLDIVGEQVAEIKEIAEEQGWADPAKVQELGERPRSRAEGVKSGVPDICLPVARGGYHGLFIELKRQHGNTATKNQNTWLADLREQGYATAVAYGWEQAAKIITDYMEGEYENK